MRSRGRIFAGLLAAVLLAGAAVTAAGLVGDDLLAAARRVAVFGAPLLEIRSPHPQQMVPQGGIEVIVRFLDSERTAIDTFRCLLNGHDVTESLTRGENGAAGSVVGAIDGENRLRIEVFGRAWWGRSLFEDAVEVTFHVRPFPSLDRASGGAGQLDTAGGGLSLAPSRVRLVSIRKHWQI